MLARPGTTRFALSKVESDLSGESSRPHEMGAAESGEKVVKRQFIGPINHCQLSAPFARVSGGTGYHRQRTRR
jgi:hypothetical protein